MTKSEPLPARIQCPPVALTIGGSDSGGGAGIQADLKTFAVLQVHGCSALTCVTAQNTIGVERVDALPPQSLVAQIEAVCRDLPVAALKTGMLLRCDLIEATASAIASRSLWRVIDPVMVSRAGAVLLEPEAIAALRTLLLPLADLLTPNLREASLLVGRPLEGERDVEAAAESIAALGPRAVLIKGGGSPSLRGCDWLLEKGGGRWLRRPPVETPHSHGSGCTLSAAITAWLARGLPLGEAVGQARAYVEGGLIHSLAIGAGQGPLCHWHPLLTVAED
jgi:hydroxymethylpyrimidine/phosphomethylpyrimidine kinase